MAINRREWIQKSLLASSALLLPTINYGNSAIEKEIGEDLLRLHWNENPFGPPQSVIDQVKRSAADCNLYWDETLEALAMELGAKQGLKKDNYFITSGSTEILALLGQHIGLMGGEILTPCHRFRPC